MTEHKADYLFLTDVATTYDSDCIKNLATYLDKHPEVTAVCGRQRAMSPHDQGDNAVNKLAEWEATGLRHLQVAEFEGDAPVSKRVWDMLGFHPVLPGPCGMYRCLHLRDKRAEQYFNTVATASEEVTLALANLKIAEDRIPSLFAVFSPESGDEFITHWVNTATFYFEAETSLKAFVLQRRRWLNGTIGGYVEIWN
eukprot:COSAG05_NODE_3566_length_1987_cov_1.358581_1_plen_196_part_10